MNHLAVGETGMLFDERFELLTKSGQSDDRAIAATKSIITVVESHYKVKLTEQLGASFVNHLAITIKRLLEGETMMEAPDELWQEVQNYPQELALATAIVSGLEKELDCTVPRDEVGFIALHLCRIKIESQSN